MHEIDQDVFDLIPEEKLQVSVDRILPKLDLNAAPWPTGFWSGYLCLWTGAFAPTSAEDATEHLELLISDIANDKLPA
jgi:hypothetical protein